MQSVNEESLKYKYLKVTLLTVLEIWPLWHKPENQEAF